MNVIIRKKSSKKYSTQINKNEIEIIDYENQTEQKRENSENNNNEINNYEEVPTSNNNNNIKIYKNRENYEYVTHEKEYKPFPLCLSILVLILNIFLPGFGTFISICGVNSCNVRCKLIFRACIQFITIPFFLTGWFLALSQSILFIKSRKYKSFEEFLYKERNNEVLLFIGKEDEFCEICNKKCSNQCDCCNYCCGECCQGFCKHFSKTLDLIRKIIFFFTYNFSHCIPCYSWYVCVLNSKIVYYYLYCCIGCFTCIINCISKLGEKKNEKNERKKEPKVLLEYETPDSLTLEFREKYLINIGEKYGEKNIIYEQKGLG